MLNLAKYAKIRLVLVVFMLSFMVTATHAQFNVKVGYTLGFVSPEVNNAMLQSYNENLSTFYDDFQPASDIKLIYGVSLGARMKFGIGSLELNWENLGRTITSVGFINPLPPTPPTSTTEEFRYSLNMLMLTYETSYRSIGVGSSIGRNLINIKRGTSEKVSLFKDADRSQYFVRFHVAFNFSGNSTVAFAIKPFIQIPLSEIDLQPVADKINATNVGNNEKFPMFGLAFAFYNGRQ